ncbi:A/G-specific adenine glycosylase [Kitasatospora sp. CM 4170]|uniref:Adenine DNA glycosylase n=1 Tax=Kitasatospora aburaviensis TaxID=67265 RepID=A0ABW1EY08_9ACTN|nr:A/G-specific adenine glycosylase [Kitasatospora sp. CM 4170]WNM46451.1 A/G-specific adenine glycosylase [Kitasatospora sp. CM 4170]
MAATTVTPAVPRPAARPATAAGPAGADTPAVPLALPLPVLHSTVLGWYEANARDLPWRTPEATPWAVMVSEFMLQQTPVKRVLPVWAAWLERWPTPADLAAEAPGEAVRMWGRLGYPRRALRLHAAAVAITGEHGGEVPDDHATLLSLPGVGEYTAAAVASFAFRQRHVVLDTNVRRVFARAVTGVEYPAQATTAAERRTATALLPADTGTAATWAVAVMELGALVCTARGPECGDCPLFTACAWQRAGCPPYEGPARRGQSYEGTDRQVRGKLLAVLRAEHGTVEQARLDAVWPDPVQRARALDGLVADGLVEPVEQGVYRLPQ